LRRKAAGLGIHFYVFVDDVLCIGDDAEKTQEGMMMLEEEFAARGLQIAPNKTRGPCRCIEFLGLLLCNMEELRGITITRKRRAKLTAEMEKSWERRPAEGALTADPRELASFLGKLVFVSQVVRGGRTYMQWVLSQFQGLVVDWRRGEVKPRGEKWQRLEMHQSFWRDLAWWRVDPSRCGGRFMLQFRAQYGGAADLFIFSASPVFPAYCSRRDSETGSLVTRKRPPDLASPLPPS
jgi:hypothetical protein